MLEKRTFTRVVFDIDATLEYDGEEFPSRIVNLSVKGALVNTGASPMKGRAVAVKFCSEVGDESIAFCCPGRVIRADSRGVGIEFEGLDMNTFEQLRDIIAAKSSDPSVIMEEFDNFVWRWEKQTRTQDTPTPPLG